MKRKLIALGLIVVMTFSSIQLAGATSAQQKKSEAESNLNSINNKIDDIKQKQNSLQSEIDQLDAELVQVLMDLDIIADEITQKKAELEQAKADLEAAKIKEAEQYEAMKQRIRFMYENGDSSFFTALMGAEDFADVLNKVESFSKVYDYDRNLLIEYQNTKTQVENLVAQVEEEEAELEETEESYQEEESHLESLKAEKGSQMANFESQLSDAQNLADQYRSTIEEQNRIIAQQEEQRRAQAAASRGSSSVNSNSSGSKSPSSGSGSNDYSSKGSGSGSAVADYACQFVGNPYVWGGESLTGGADCSGFIKSVYAHFGVSLPHSSSALRSVGYGVSYSEAQPGDIICYSGHVALYLGGGQIVHASNSAPYPKGGIKISGNAAYRTIVAVRRIF